MKGRLIGQFSAGFISLEAKSAFTSIVKSRVCERDVLHTDDLTQYTLASIQFCAGLAH
jgi:hypothetical protein